MKIFEIFSSGKNIDNSDVKWETVRLPDGSLNSVGSFYINNNMYQVSITRKSTLAEIGFQDLTHGMNRTNRGDALKVFNKVYSIVDEYIRTKNPPRLQCAGADEKLNSFYQKLIPRFAKRYSDKYDFDSSSTDSVGRRIFKLNPKSFKGKNNETMRNI